MAEMPTLAKLRITIVMQRYTEAELLTVLKQVVLDERFHKQVELRALTLSSC